MSRLVVVAMACAVAVVAVATIGLLVLNSDTADPESNDPVTLTSPAGEQTQSSQVSQERSGWTVDTGNVGLAANGLTCDSLPVYSAGDRPPAGTVISRVRIEHGLVLAAGDITIEDSCIQPVQAGKGLPLVTTTDNNNGSITPTPVTIRNSEIDGSKLDPELAAHVSGFIGVANLENNYIHDVGSGIAIMNSGSDLSAVIEGNYVTKLRAWGDPATTGNHSDGFTVRDFPSAPGRELVVRGNRFDSDSGNDTGAFFIQTYGGDIDNVVIAQNLLEGGGYQLVLGAGFGNAYSNVRAINNRFSGTGFGPGYVEEGTPGWTEQSGNYINDPTQAENRGEPVVF